MADLKGHSRFHFRQIRRYTRCDIGISNAKTHRLYESTNSYSHLKNVHYYFHTFDGFLGKSATSHIAMAFFVSVYRCVTIVRTGRILGTITKCKR